MEADQGYNMNKRAALALLIEAEVTNMSSIKPLSEQTLMNNYVFSMVMREPGRIRPLLEYILNKKIRSISMVEPEKTMKEKFESKGIRLDLYVEDIDGVVYDCEVQTTDQKNLPRRMRYYQGMLDITLIMQ